ncbi:CLUMA_CG020321, isoform A [Clunio marinus]|uniref:CLUMA_CG020321, isoform A n=1 Tax=Clunio marinus TaxID=568069 RepID=A0A1J1J797_9DIPT|nr:CLUMA_CG020321, isoform A [Clunio marinus]
MSVLLLSPVDDEHVLLFISARETKQKSRIIVQEENVYEVDYAYFSEYRDYCENTRDCREYAYICNKNSCECTEGYKLDEKNKTCIGGTDIKRID